MNRKEHTSIKTGWSATMEGPDHRGVYLVELWDASGSRIDKTQCFDGRRDALSEFHQFKVRAELGEG